MKIVTIVPGSGDNFYCENCVRDIAIVRALKKAGHEVTPIPLYLPQINDTLDTNAPIFFGGINSWLQQNSWFFRKTPRFMDAVFDSNLFLKMAAKRAGSARAKDLGEMTLSVMKGADGKQKKELARLIKWMEKTEKPDIVHISNPMLLGIGTEIKRRWGVPVVCSLQDEQDWIDAMTPPYPELCWDFMAEYGRNVDAYIAVSRSFGEVMRRRLKIDEERLHVVHIGLDTSEAKVSGLPEDRPVIGYLARMTRSLGLGDLVESFLALRKEFPALRLHVSGGKTADDDEFLDFIRGRIKKKGAENDVEFFDEFDAEARREFFAGLSVFSVPAPKGVAFGTYILESLAAGVPVVLPKTGSFPELVEATGGGVLYDGRLTEALGKMLNDRDKMKELGRRGREAVAEKFTLDVMGRQISDVYEGILRPRDTVKS